MPYKDAAKRRAYQNARYHARKPKREPLPPSEPVDDAAETFFGRPFLIPEWQGYTFVRRSLRVSVRRG